MNLNQIINMLPQGMRNKAQTALQQALQTIDPSQIKTREDALNVVNQLKMQGLPNSVFDKVSQYLNSPIATPILGALGVSKQEIKDGLQSIAQLDVPSASTTSSLLSGIDQLK